MKTPGQTDTNSPKYGPFLVSKRPFCAQSSNGFDVQQPLKTLNALKYTSYTNNLNLQLNVLITRNCIKYADYG